MARANKFYVQVDGAKELDRDLELMGDGAAAVLDAAVIAGGRIALQKAKQYARSRIKNGTGNLERNIIIKPVIRRAGHSGKKRRIERGSVSIGVSRAGKKGDANNAYYGSFVELGTKYQTAKKFMRDAVDWNRGKIARAVVDKFKSIMRG
jgi:HK97 gp10 family phage protein